MQPEPRTSAVDDTALSRDLRGAVRNHGVRVVLQPLFSARDGHLQCLEALARWHHPTLGPVPPDRFIPLAERSGLIVSLGRAVLFQACEAVAALNAERPGRLPVRAAVNVSPGQLADPLVVRDIADALRESGLAADLLEIEVTEGVDVTDERLVAMLRRIKALGVRLVMDDFGTGVSCLNHVTRLPLDLVKLDRSLVEPVATQPRTALLLGETIALMQRVGLGVAAEGVETEEQGRLLHRLGADGMQGFGLCRPLEVAQLDRLDLREAEVRARVAGWQVASGPTVSSARRPSILVVEDDPAAAHLMRYLLTSALGARVVLAANGSEFESLIQQERPDLVLMDVELPDACGVDLVTREHARSGRTGLPFVAVTAHGDRLTGSAGTEFAGLLPKPLEAPAFVTKVASFLAASAPLLA